MTKNPMKSMKSMEELEEWLGANQPKNDDGKIIITLDQAIELLSWNLCPDDFGCTSWTQATKSALEHVDGVAVFFAIDDEYEVTH